ncbi:MAG: DUF4214 domain-containing protein [Pseudomonadota bacterium]
MATVAEQIQKVYIGLLGRAADQAGLDYWTDEIESGALTLEQLRANIVEEQPEYANGIGDMSRAQAVNQLYQNLFNRSAEDEGLDYWVNGGGADVSFDQLVMALVDGASAADTLALDNKAQVAEYYTAQAGADYSAAAARAAVDDVDGDTAMADARADVDARIEQGAASQSLTQQADNLRGTDGDDVFEAPVTQDETGSGAVANTFETGDVLDGGEGMDVLNANLTASLSGAVPIAPTISAETDSIEVVNLRAQFPNLADTTIDAENMNGVEQWWSDNSRSGILVEDIRSNPADTAFGMRDTDPGVGFASYINANFLEGGTEVGESAFNFTIQEANALGNELQDITVNGIRFELNGESYELGGADVEAANTWGELETALQADLDATDGLDGLTVEHQGSGQFVVTDPEAGDFVVDPAGTVISSSTTNEVKAASLGVPQVTELPTETDIFLDGAGNGSQGGMLDVGVMSGDRGVEVFNTTVVSDSHVSGMMSSNLRNGDQYLEEVLVEGEGDLTVGNTDNPMDRALGGLTNVRVLDASELDGSLNAGIVLNANAVGRYLDDAEEPVDFQYTGTANDDMLNLNVSQAVAGDPDFAMQVDAGAGDDLINLVNNSDLAGVSLDGGEGRDVLETASDIGTSTASTPADFANIEELVLTGNGTDADMAELSGVESVTVATTGGSTTVSNLEADTTLTISGERQTQGNDSNDDQNFGTITLTDAQAQSQLVTLDNTARVDGVMNVGGLTVDGNNSAVRELTLESGGRRDTSNVVNNISAAMVTSLAFTGSQDLDAEVDLMGQNANGNAVAFDVTGAELGGDLDLDIDADLITASNGRDRDVTLTGTEGMSDSLTLDGNGSAQDITTDTTVTGFETVVLDNFIGDVVSGEVVGLDAANFNGVELYYVADLDGATTVTSLNAGENVVLSDQGADDADLTLEGPGNGAVNLTLEDTGENGLTWGGNDLSVNGFADVNLDIEHNGSESTTLDLLLDNYGENSANEVDGDVENLVITGGNADGDDSLELTTDLPASLSVIDVSGFDGDFTATLGDAVDDTPDSVNNDTRFVLDGNDADITLTDLTTDSDPTAPGTPGDADSVDFNTIFEFTSAGTTADPSTWTIDNFVAEGADNAGNGNYSILDISDLGISSFAGLDFTDDTAAGGGVTITEEGGSSTWEIVLTGVLEADLAPSENFIFA